MEHVVLYDVYQVFMFMGTCKPDGDCSIQLTRLHSGGHLMLAYQ
jgi:hypothetical protein